MSHHRFLYSILSLYLSNSWFLSKGRGIGSGFYTVSGFPGERPVIWISNRCPRSGSCQTYLGHNGAGVTSRGVIGGQPLSGLAAFLVSPEPASQSLQFNKVRRWFVCTNGWEALVGTVIMITDVQCCVLLVRRTDAWSQFIICPEWLFVIVFVL